MKQNANIISSHCQTRNRSDNALTQDKRRRKLYIRLFWSGVDDNEIAAKVLHFIPDGFDGTLLDVPVGTAVFTHQKYQSLNKATITCLDYSEDKHRIERTEDGFLCECAADEWQAYGFPSQRIRRFSAAFRDLPQAEAYRKARVCALS